MIFCNFRLTLHTPARISMLALVNTVAGYT